MRKTFSVRTSCAVFMSALVMSITAPAYAHVGISPNEAEKGSYGVFSFRVPNESDTANTVKLEVQFPQDHPIASVRTTDQDGWKTTVTKSVPTQELTNHGESVDEVVSTISWEGGKIEPGKYAEFHVSMGPLPEDASSIAFKAIQTYDDGSVVSWIQESSEGHAEADYPAPTLTLTEGSGDEHSAPQSDPDDSAKKVETKKSSSTTPGYVGIGIGILALIVAAGALLKKK